MAQTQVQVQQFELEWWGQKDVVLGVILSRCGSFFSPPHPMHPYMHLQWSEVDVWCPFSILLLKILIDFISTYEYFVHMFGVCVPHKCLMPTGSDCQEL